MIFFVFLRCILTRFAGIALVTAFLSAMSLAFFANTALAINTHETKNDSISQVMSSLRHSCYTVACKQAEQAIASGSYNDAARLYLEKIQTLSLHVFAPGPTSVSDLYILAAHALERAGNYDTAGHYYLLAARELELLRDFLYIQAARNLVRADVTRHQLEEMMSWSAFQQDFKHAGLILAKIESQLHGLPSLDTAQRALSASESDTCPWLLDTLLSDGSRTERDMSDAKNFEDISNLAYSRCLDARVYDLFTSSSAQPRDLSRLNRAQLYFGNVRFQEANGELSRIEGDALAQTDRCRMTFIRARTLDRLRQRDAALNAFQSVVDQCHTEANEDERVRSLYAIGRTRFMTNRLEASRTAFDTLLSDYPHRSHADDALFFLARIERKHAQPGHLERQRALLQRALSEYPQEDMVHEMVWEVFEHLFRARRYREFIDEISELALPDYDNQYFSQGRLEYFLGASHRALKEDSKSVEQWQKAWVNYPFSFYGYLSHLRLIELGVTPESLDSTDTIEHVDWFDTNWRSSGTYHLVRLGLHEAACDFERASQRGVPVRDTHRWRLAAICHHAGEYPLSHNIARRQIPGRPWSTPHAGLFLRWHIAWPNPYAHLINPSVEDELAQWSSNVRVLPAFASAIIREESSFIEDIESWAGALGLMQLMPQTALAHDEDIQGRATPERLKVADINIRVGVDHLFTLANRYKNHPVYMAAAYNAGSGRVNRWARTHRANDIALWVEAIPILETRDYTKRVIGSYAAYQWLSGLRELDSTVAQPSPR